MSEENMKESLSGLISRLEEKASDSDKMIKAVYRKFPKDSKMKTGGKLKVMLTGPVADVLGKKQHDSVILQDLSDGDLGKLYNRVMGIKESDEEILEAVADTTLKQLGGRGRLTSMIGAKDIMSDDGGKSLVFKFSNRGAKKPNYVKITLNARDYYDIEFGRITMKKDPVLPIKMPEYNKLKTVKDVDVESLANTFEKNTGLYLRL